MTSLPIFDISGYEIKCAQLYAELQKTRIPLIRKGTLWKKKDGTEVYISQRGDVIGHIGRSMNFGYGMIRAKGFGEYVTNTKYPELYKCIIEFANTLLPPHFIYHTVTVNHNVKAKKHIDSYNCGDSIIVGIGDYTGGNLRVYSNETDYVSYSIKDCPLMFNGATAPHETEDFVGERYTLIFLRHKREHERLAIHT